MDDVATPDSGPLPDFPPEVSPFDIEVERFVQLRDAIKAADDAHSTKTKQARDELEAMKARLLARLILLGGESVKTTAGTVYRTGRKSATIADGAAFRQHVISQNLWDIVDWRANAPAVANYIELHKAAPPGVNFSIAYTVGVRRGDN